jgi:chromate reductase, NAD(P)H dehydrogenase (quinone)
MPTNAGADNIAKNIGVIVGSLRAGAYTRMLAQALPESAPATLRLHDIAIGELPLYNQDLETQSPPPAWTRFRQQVLAADALLFVTPEYNRSIPGALKNALDVGSRPWGQSAWNAKRAGVISLTPGALGAMAANLHLRQVLYAVNITAMAYPEAYIPAAATLFDENGRLVKDDARAFLKEFLLAFAQWVH